MKNLFSKIKGLFVKPKSKPELSPLVGVVTPQNARTVPIVNAHPVVAAKKAPAVSTLDKVKADAERMKKAAAKPATSTPATKPAAKAAPAKAPAKKAAPAKPAAAKKPAPKKPASGK